MPRLKLLGRRRSHLVVRPVMGLANRLRGITSAAGLADHLGLRLAVHWAPGRGFSSEGFRDLFANDLELWDRDRYERALESGAPVVTRWLGWKERRPPDPSFDPAHALDEMAERGLVYDEAFMDLDAWLRQRGVAVPRGARRGRKRWCRRLRAVPSIEARAAAFAREHFAGRRVVGVHVRRGDSLDAPYAHVYLPSTDAAFGAAMTRAIDDDPKVRFFLATDCRDTRDAFSERFQGRVVSTDKEFVKSVFDAPKEGQADAVVDLLLLSRTRRVIGTAGSSFGRMAARIGGIPFREARES